MGETAEALLVWRGVPPYRQCSRPPSLIIQGHHHLFMSTSWLYTSSGARLYPLSTRREPYSRTSYHCTHTGAFLPNPSETITARIRYPTTTSAMQSGPQALHRLGPPGACPAPAHPTTALTPVHSLIIQRRSLPRFVIQPPRLVQALDHLGPPS